MITKNYTRSNQNSRIGAIYSSIKTSLSSYSCPNCWGTQEYDRVQLDGKELKAPKNSYGLISLIQHLAKGFVSNSKTNCATC